MTTLALAYSNINKRVRILSLPRIDCRLFCLCSFFVVLCLSVFYVYQINTMTHGTYLIKDYNNQIDALSEQSMNLEMNFAKTSFMGTINQKVQALSFEKVKEVKYVQVLEDSAMAKAKINN